VIFATTSESLVGVDCDTFWAQIPISEVAKISFSRGPAMIRDEDGQLTGYVYMDLSTTDYGAS